MKGDSIRILATEDLPLTLPSDPGQECRAPPHAGWFSRLTVKLTHSCLQNQSHRSEAEN